MNAGDIVELRWKPTGSSHEWVAMYASWDHNVSDLIDYFRPEDLGVVLRFGEKYDVVSVMLLGKATLGWVPSEFLKVKP